MDQSFGWSLQKYHVKSHSPFLLTVDFLSMLNQTFSNNNNNHHHHHHHLYFLR